MKLYYSNSNKLFYLSHMLHILRYELSNIKALLKNTVSILFTFIITIFLLKFMVLNDFNDSKTFIKIIIVIQIFAVNLSSVNIFFKDNNMGIITQLLFMRNGIRNYLLIKYFYNALIIGFVCTSIILVLIYSTIALSFNEIVNIIMINIFSIATLLSIVTLFSTICIRYEFNLLSIFTLTLSLPIAAFNIICIEYIINHNNDGNLELLLSFNIILIIINLFSAFKVLLFSLEE